MAVVKLGDDLLKDIDDFQKQLQAWKAGLSKRVEKQHKIVGVRWRSEAQKRVPVDTGFLRQKILSNVYSASPHVYTTECGTNVEGYPVYLEFGTRFIAHGQVLKIGSRIDVTDIDAVHTWKAKREDAIEATSHSIDDKRQLYNAANNAVAGPQEQMPWLRPSFNEIKSWVIDTLELAFKGMPGTGGP